MAIEVLDKKVDDIHVLLTDVNARCKSNTKRLDDHDGILKENATLITAIKELAVETKYMREELNKAVSRLDVLEKKDSEKWDKFIWLIVGTLVALIVGYIGKQVGLK